jgi:outer membrane immunogenic protein
MEHLGDDLSGVVWIYGGMDPMTKIFVAGAVFCALVAPAVAADMPIAAPVPAPVGYDWTGLYVGAHAGWEYAETQGSTILLGLGDNLTGPTDQKMHGWLGGAQLGYNHQFQRVVLGLELSGSWDDVRNLANGAGTTSITRLTSAACFQSFALGAVGAPITSSVSCNAKENWTAQALARIGYTFGNGRFLPYLSAGAAVTRLNIANTLTVVPSAVVLNQQDTWGANRNLVGAVLGGGAQYAVGNGFSIGVEYLYAVYDTKDFSSMASTTVNGVPGNPVPLVNNHDLTTQTVRLVGNYKFD